MKKQTKKKLIVFTSILIPSLLILYLTFTAFGIINYSKQDEKTTCDVAVVLGAGTKEGEVSPVFRERINHGIWLYENGYVDYIILTGGTGYGNAVSDAEAAKQYAVSQGMPEDVLFTEDKSTITEENLENAKIIMDENSFEKAIIVSDPLHMKRAMLMAGDYGIEAYSSPTPTTMYKSLKTQIPFLVREEFFYIGYSIVRIFR